MRAWTRASAAITLVARINRAAFLVRTARRTGARMAQDPNRRPEFFEKNRPGEIVALRVTDLGGGLSKVSMPSATTVMPRASLSDSIARKIPWLRGRLWMSVMNDRSILISSAVMSASADNDE